MKQRNEKEQDAYARVLAAREGWRENASIEYLLKLEEQVSMWLEAITTYRRQKSYREAREIYHRSLRR